MHIAYLAVTSLAALMNGFAAAMSFAGASFVRAVADKVQVSQTWMVPFGALLAAGFEQHRSHLRAVAYRMLGSAGDADDALQEAWLRLHDQDRQGIENMQAWLTTVVGRVCLNVLRSRRFERQWQTHVPDPVVVPGDEADAVQETLVADSVGLALQLVLDSLTPAERLAFVLHDMFGVPFAEIAGVLDRSEGCRPAAGQPGPAARVASPVPSPGIRRIVRIDVLRDPGRLDRLAPWQPEGPKTGSR